MGGAAVALSLIAPQHAARVGHRRGPTSAAAVTAAAGGGCGDAA
eukprot:gene3330-21600_t